MRSWPQCLKQWPAACIRCGRCWAESALLIDVAETLATAIGALADDAIGGAVFGDSARWWHGPFFDDASVTDGQESPERQ